ncbi:ABC transporter substrate-binding protein [Defluviitalea raffinosedens]|nr:extracellular solute-binding protein [Defluviitalea raffinosedens]
MNEKVKIKLKVLAVNDPAVDVYIDKNYKVLENYDDDTVDIQFDIVPWDSYFPTMLKVFNGETSYDIIMVAGHLWLADFVTKQYLEPMDYEFEDILPVIAQEMQYQGKTYLSPSFCDGHVIVYRKSTIEKVLGKPLDPVITVDQFIEVAKKLKENGIDSPIALKAHQSEILTDALPYLRSTGLDLYEIKDNKVVCNIKKMEEGLNKYLSLKSYAPDDTYTFGNNEIKEVLAHNKVAMAVTWSGQLGVVTKECDDLEDLGFSTFDTAWNVTWSFAITKNSQNKEKAKAFLAYLRSKEVDRLVGAYCGAPVRKNSYIEGMNKYPWYKVQLDMIENQATPLIDLLQAGDKNNVLYEEIYNVFTGQKEVREALKDAESRIEAVDERRTL